MRWARLAPPLLLLCLGTLTRAFDLPDIPQCAVRCQLEAIPQTACAPNNQTCLCKDTSYINLVEPCVKANCKVKEALGQYMKPPLKEPLLIVHPVTQNITTTECGFPTTNDFAVIKIIRIVLFLVLPTLAIILRLIVKIARISTWGADDTTIVLAYIFLITIIPLNHLNEMNGAGRDIWTLSFDQIDHYFMTFFIAQLLYTTNLMLIKCSILFIFLRIFPGEKIRVVLWATQAFSLALGVAYILLGVFQCQPIDLVWKQWSREYPGHCVPLITIGLSHGAINIALDVWMLLLPVTQVMALNMKRQKKWAVLFMFSLGLFLTIASIIRLRAIMMYTVTSTNPTVDSTPSAVWSDVELDVGIFTACIPNMRQFVCRFVLRESRRAEKLSSTHAQNRSLEEKPPPPLPTARAFEEELRC
ncbi:CFEM domain-containing protein [Colletotrichum orchidophilum]|uniref:CFEM domain-containing protein n=1 Tax=Colletotrichum orchidophilum TaxID=1209926 RepID=A0A1G4ATL5_9PEZI|nr:CFEM domain-containing protein [Colletotrichum orchidophilum]OHE92445.1 CFEM domain-containing protein [Colletotrichum orchidophilum]